MKAKAMKIEWGKAAALAFAGTLAFGANASSVTIDSVTQRWPWNNKVDITYTVDGGQTLTPDGTGDVYYRLVFTANIGGQTYEIDGVTNIGASASTGQHTVTWTPPADLKVKATGCTMTASLYSAEAPSGDDYMVVDLGTGVVSFEGLLGSQDRSNERYTNNVAYKTDYMVLRKVSRGVSYYAAPYTNRTVATNWKKTEWTPKYDYYVGIFPVTKGQFNKIGLTTSWKYSATQNRDTNAYSPADDQSWDKLRASTANPTEAIPPISSYTGTSFFQWLNLKTGNRFAFDLPTVLMAEIARRAGTTTIYNWNSDTLVSSVANIYMSNYSNSSRGSSTSKYLCDVDARRPNGWGVFDTQGNLWEWCLDDGTASGATVMPLDIFTPVWNQAGDRCVSGGPTFDQIPRASDSTYGSPKIRDDATASFYKCFSKGTQPYTTFRAYCIMK